jgi:hypothetical protein
MRARDASSCPMPSKKSFGGDKCKPRDESTSPGSGRSSFATQITVFRNSVFVAPNTITTFAARGRGLVSLRQIRGTKSVAKLRSCGNRGTRRLPGAARGCRCQLGRKGGNEQYTKSSQNFLSHFRLH